MTPLKQQISLIPFSIEHTGIALISDGVLKIISCLQNDRTNERMTENDHITYALLTEVIIIIMIIIIIIIYYRPRDRVKIDRQHIFN